MFLWNKTTLAIKFFKGVVNSQIKVKIRICTFQNPDDILYISSPKKYHFGIIDFENENYGILLPPTNRMNCVSNMF